MKEFLQDNNIINRLLCWEPAVEAEMLDKALMALKDIEPVLRWFDSFQPSADKSP